MDSFKDPITGWLYKQELAFCGKERCKKCAKGEGHGPYWYAYRWEGGKTRKKYIGKTLPASLTEDSEESYVRTEDALPKTSLPKTSLPKTSLPKTSLPKTSLPKTDEGVVENALEAIRSFHNRGVEPTAAEVAVAVGMKSRPLGRIMKAVGLQAVKCHRGGVQARRYTFELKEKTEEAARSNSISSSR